MKLNTIRRALLLIATAGALSAGCGIEPIKPIPPAGCKDVVAECICEANGRNCRYVWRCVKY